MMAADCQTENDIIDVLKSKTRDMPPLVRSHLAYLAGRVRRDRSSEMLGVLKQISSIPKAGAAQPTKARKQR